VEADTLDLADREQAREAALAGLRARAAEHQAKLDTGAPTAATTAPPTPAPAPAAAAPPAEALPAVPESAGEPPGRAALWVRFLVASVVIVVAMATATSVSGIVYLDSWAEKLGDSGQFAELKDQLAESEGGAPQTILILGSDERLTPEFAGDPGRSDTTILLRADPDKDTLTLLSIPRDLKVNIPGHGVDKFNAAYSYGGADLTLRTVKSLTGLDINHVVNINFTGFADAVNAIDCVYIDVDRRYFIPPESGVAEINIEAGYQRLCGLKALQYVRYRHDDNDLVRSARQQDFLREARAKVPPSKLIADRNELLKIFTDYTTSDIDSGITLLEVLKTFVGAAGAPLREVHFPAELGGPDSPYVTASAQAIKTAVAQFLGEDQPAPPSGEETAPKPEPKRGEAKKKGKQKHEKKKQPTGPPMTDATGAIQPYAQKLAATKTNGGEPMIKFPLFYPTQVPEASIVTPTVLEASRAFPIDGPGDDLYRGYKFVLGIPGSQGFTEYYGVSGTNWEDPPILENPSETRKINGRDYLLFYDGDRLRVVGWKDKKASYWINNTLLQTLDEDEMLAIATSMRQLGG
jgi:LCP family protein required for cell wall assembly